MLGVVECMGNRRGWEGVPIERILQEKTGVRVFAENDVRAGALSRHLFSSERSSGAALYVYVGLGIGAALAGSDELLRGAHNLAGLLSYTVVDCQKQVPGSRQHGSLEDLASDAAFIKSIWPDRQLDPAEMSAEEHVSLTTRAYEMAKSGDVVAASALMSVTRYLGLAIVNAISLLDPKIVFVCGTLVDIAQDEVVDLIRREALQHVYPGAQGVEIRPLSDSYEFLVRGAVGLVLWQPYEGLLRKGLKLVTN
jgi:predicted NBD/HSP70 family sugar kinase